MSSSSSPLLTRQGSFPEDKFGFISIPFRRLSLITGGLPFSAFLFCLFWSLFFDFEKTTETHCEMPEFAPSISSVIGGHLPQKYFWTLAIALHSAPRLLFTNIEYSFLRHRLAPQTKWTARVMQINYWLGHTESMALLGLSFVPSDEVFIIHAVFFVTFLVTSIMCMILTSYFLLALSRYHPTTRQERASLNCKRWCVKMSLAMVLLFGYFYWRHNEYCEPYVYSFAALCEYVAVLTNMAYHMTAYMDYGDWFVSAAPSGAVQLSAVR